MAGRGALVVFGPAGVGAGVCAGVGMGGVGATDAGRGDSAVDGVAGACAARSGAGVPMRSAPLSGDDGGSVGLGALVGAAGRGARSGLSADGTTAVGAGAGLPSRVGEGAPEGAAEATGGRGSEAVRVGVSVAGAVVCTGAGRPAEVSPAAGTVLFDSVTASGAGRARSEVAPALSAPAT